MFATFKESENIDKLTASLNYKKAQSPNIHHFS